MLLMALIFNALLIYFYAYITGGEDLVAESARVPFFAQVHRAFTTQMTILGIVSACLFFAYKWGVIYLWVGDKQEGEHGPYSGTSFFIEVSLVNACIFLCMCLYYIFVSSTVWWAQRMYHHIAAYHMAPEKPEFFKLRKMELL